MMMNFVICYLYFWFTILFGFPFSSSWGVFVYTIERLLLTNHAFSLFIHVQSNNFCNKFKVSNFDKLLVQRKEKNPRNEEKSRR